MKKIILAIVIIIIVAIFGIGGYFAHQKYFSPTAGWKTYNSQLFGYSVNYPKSYNATEKDSAYMVVFSSADENFMAISEVPAFLGNHQFQNVDDYWTTLSHECEDSNYKTPSDAYTCRTLVGKESISGTNFLIFKEEGYLDNGQKSNTWSLQAFFMHNDYAFSITSSPKMDEGTFYSVIRSIKFTK